MQTRVLAGVLVILSTAGQVSSVMNFMTSVSLELKLSRFATFVIVLRSLMVVSGGIPLGGGKKNISVNAIQASLLEETFPSAVELMEIDISPPVLLRLHADVRENETHANELRFSPDACYAHGVKSRCVTIYVARRAIDDMRV